MTSLATCAAEPPAEAKPWAGLLSATALTPSTVASRADLAFSEAASPAEEIASLTEAFTDCRLPFLLIESGIEYPDSQNNMVCYGIRDEAVESAGCSARQWVCFRKCPMGSNRPQTCHSDGTPNMNTCDRI